MRKTLLLLTTLALAGCNQAAPTAPEKPAATSAKPGEAPINTIDRSHAGEPGPAATYRRP